MYEDAKIPNAVQDSIHERVMQQQQSSSTSSEPVSCYGEIGTKPSGPGLRHRVAAERDEAERKISRAMALAELQQLLGKHPHIARILDLRDELRV